MMELDFDGKLNLWETGFMENGLTPKTKQYNIQYTLLTIYTLYIAHCTLHNEYTEPLYMVQ